MHPGDSSTHPTDPGRIDGWVTGSTTGSTTRVRQARPADLPTLTGILALAGVPLLSGVRHAIEDGTAATALHPGLGDTPQAFVAAAGPATGDLDRTVTEVAPAVSLVLVAEHDRHGIVAGLMAVPPVYLLAQLRTGANAAREHEQLRTLLLRCTKIQAMAVTEPARGHRLGATLLHHCCAVYRRCGHRLVYGQTPPNRDPAEYYRQEGFDVLEPGEPLDLEPACGLHTRLTPATTEQICIFLQSPPTPGQDRHETRHQPR